MFRKHRLQSDLLNNLMKFLALIVGIFLFSQPVSASGVFDSTFGAAGKTNISFSDRTVYAEDAAFQADGKIVIAGYSSLNVPIIASNDFTVIRLNGEGTIDTTFGSGGLVITDIAGNSQDIANAVAVQPDGKIIAGGFSQAVGQSANPTFTVVRYNSNGSLDTTFGSGGKVLTDFTESSQERINDLFVLAEGKILAVGSYGGNSFPGVAARIAFVRYNADGSLDANYGGGGKFLVRFNNGLGFTHYTDFRGAALQPDGKIVIAGWALGANRSSCVSSPTVTCDNYYSVLFRYNSEMVLDKKFGRRFGREYSAPGENYFGVAALSDGRIIVGGDKIKAYSSSGRLNSVFSPPAISNVNFPVHLIAGRQDGTIVGCGDVGIGELNRDIGVVLYGANGSLIGSDKQDLSSQDFCQNVLIQPDDKIVVVGNGRNGFAAFRYLNITP
jgi:uncharacterized delta-60 repeat protein